MPGSSLPSGSVSPGSLSHARDISSHHHGQSTMNFHESFTLRDVLLGDPTAPENR